LLYKHFGDTSQPEIIKAIGDLAALNPTVKSAYSSLNLGDWKLISAPNFPGIITPKPGQESIYQFTLGSMSNNMYQPSNLVCTVKSVINSIPKSDHNVISQLNAENKCSLYRMLSNITINAPEGDLESIMEVYGIVEPKDDNRLSVVFNGGSLIPASSVTTNIELNQLWKETFKDV